MVLQEILAHAALNDIEMLVGIYKPTERNKMVEEHYRQLGFEQMAAESDGSTRWNLAVRNASIRGAPMRVRSIGFELLDGTRRWNSVPEAGTSFPKLSPASTAPIQLGDLRRS